MLILILGLAVFLGTHSHLLSNGDVAGIVFFGSFLGWAVVDRIALKRRGDMEAVRVAGLTRADGLAVGVGSLAYLAMFVLYPYLIGVPVYLP